MYTYFLGLRILSFRRYDAAMCLDCFQRVRHEPRNSCDGDWGYGVCLFANGGFQGFRTPIRRGSSGGGASFVEDFVLVGNSRVQAQFSKEDKRACKLLRMFVFDAEIKNNIWWRALWLVISTLTYECPIVSGSRS